MTRRTVVLNSNRVFQVSTRSLSLSPTVNKNEAPSSRTPNTFETPNRTNVLSAFGSSFYSARTRHMSNGHSSIQMQPAFQALLIAERHAGITIAQARTKRSELMRLLNQNSQAEIKTFRQNHEAQYKIKLYESAQLKQLQTKLDMKTRHLLNQMEINVNKERKPLVDYIIHCVTDHIPVELHQNTMYVAKKMIS